MNITEMEENGTIDYYLKLKEFIQKFLDRNYPLSQEDMKATLKNVLTDNIKQRQEAYRILNEEMEEILNNVADKNMKMIEEAKHGHYSNYTIQDYKKDIFEFQQRMLEKLWEEQHREEEIESMPKVEESQEQTDTLQIEGEELQKPQELEHEAQISEEEKDEQLEQYGEELQEEIDSNIIKAPEFSIDDIKQKVGDVKESGYKEKMESIKRDKQVEREQSEQDNERD